MDSAVSLYTSIKKRNNLRKYHINNKVILFLNDYYDFSDLLYYNYNYIIVDNYFELYCKLKFKNECYDNISSYKEKHFLFLNNKFRNHRFYFLSKLIKNDLFPYKEYSFNYVVHRGDFIEKVIKYYNTKNCNIEEIFNFIKTSIYFTPKYIDTTNNPNTSFYDIDLFDQSILVNFFKKSFINIISETTFDNVGLPFTSEKSYFSFYFKNPVIILGDKNLVNLVRDKGYDVFDDIIDHSYDTIGDSNERRKYIVYSIKKFIQQYPKIDDINKFYKDIEPRLEYNRQLLLNKDYSQTLNNILKFLYENSE